MSYNLLSEPIRRYIRNKRWESLRKIQAAAIAHITSSEDNCILASRTASGKTEAAFLPILSKVDFNKPGVQVLYISPLIALINDQFYRIEDLCENLEVPVTKWHGEAKRSLKNRLIQDPKGIVLITPESLEAMFVHTPYNVSALFSNLQYIVIDEIHSFLGVDRGLQLMSLLSRLQQVNRGKISIVGLSATIGDDNYIEAKRLTGNINSTKVLLDRTKKPTEAKFKYFTSDSPELPLDLLKELYKETAFHKVLIFPNSRGRAEEIAVKLRKISDRVGGHKFYYSHHSSVDKEIRESIEHFAKNNEQFNFTISCTSTLELGIDIGTVDKIVQVDSTHSVASLVQRIGRSGRREGEKSMLTLYATDPWSLLQSLACWNLYNSEFLEPINTAKKPFDILLHQLLSTVKQVCGCSRTELLQSIRHNPTFNEIPEVDITDLIDKCIELDYLEKVGQELILGIAGEEIVNSREFYSMFKRELNYTVLCSGKKIGELPITEQLRTGENILLAAKIWKVIDVDSKAFKITVKSAPAGRKPKFFGDAGNIHKRIREEMLRILQSKAVYPELDQRSREALTDLRYDFQRCRVRDYRFDCPCIEKESTLKIYTFTGTKINQTIKFLISLTNTEVSLNDHTSSFELKIKKSEFPVVLADIIVQYAQIDTFLIEELQNSTTLIEFSKWGKYLPLKYQAEILKERYFDFDGAIELLDNINLIEMG